MNISIIDASNYFKGLLLLIRKDRTIAESEVHLMQCIGKTLGFDPEFCDNAIREILENEYIVDETPKFSNKEIAMKFVKDGLVIAFSDNEVHPSEEEWLMSAAEKNGIDVTWFRQEFEQAADRKELPTRLQVDDLHVQHF